MRKKRQVSSASCLVVATRRIRRHRRKRRSRRRKRKRWSSVRSRIRYFPWQPLCPLPLQLLSNPSLWQRLNRPAILILTISSMSSAQSVRSAWATIAVSLFLVSLAMRWLMPSLSSPSLSSTICSTTAWRSVRLITSQTGLTIRCCLR